MKTPAPGIAGDPGHRLYVFCWLDATIREIDPFQKLEVGRVELRHDPTPQIVRRGRRLLYSADLSGNGFVSVNGDILRSGSVMKEGPVVESVIQDGAIMRYRGTRFVLPRN